MTYSTSEVTDMRPAPWMSAKARPVRSVALSPTRNPAPAAANDEIAVRERSRAGTITIDHRSFPRQHSLTAKVTSGSILVVVPQAGRVTVVAEGDMLSVEPGHIALLGRPHDAILVWSAGAIGEVLTLRRDGLQIAASKHLGSPRRLAAVAKSIELDEAFAAALAALRAGAASPVDTARSADDDLFHGALIALVIRRHLASELFLDVRSAREAIDYIRANHQADCSPAALAAITGVTERTLRERFRQCLGLSIAAVVQDVRLDWAHERLNGARESRSIGELARAAGFGSAGSLSKAYQRRFGEPPTQTRMRAVREAGAI
jgi:AraC-like DNA-binding protein